MTSTDREEILAEGQLDQIIIHEEKRGNGSLRIAFDYQFCPSKTEVQAARDTDLNYLVAKYKPDELAAHMAAREQNRTPIWGHDFSKEPSLQEAKNSVLRMRRLFEQMPQDLQNLTGDPLGLMKFLDNQDNEAKLIALGLIKKQLDGTIIPPTTSDSPPERGDEGSKTAL